MKLMVNKEGKTLWEVDAWHASGIAEAPAWACGLVGEDKRPSIEKVHVSREVYERMAGAAWGFMRKYADRLRDAECTLWIGRDVTSGALRLGLPRQEVNATSVSIDDPDMAGEWARRGIEVSGTIHTHPRGMLAKASLIDLEQYRHYPGLHIVLPHPDSKDREGGVYVSLTGVVQEIDTVALKEMPWEVENEDKIDEMVMREDWDSPEEAALWWVSREYEIPFEELKEKYWEEYHERVVGRAGVAGRRNDHKAKLQSRSWIGE